MTRDESVWTITVPAVSRHPRHDESAVTHKRRTASTEANRTPAIARAYVSVVATVKRTVRSPPSSVKAESGAAGLGPSVGSDRAKSLTRSWRSTVGKLAAAAYGAVVAASERIGRAERRGLITEPVLKCRELHKRFGQLDAVRGVSFEIAEGETYGLLGPNGAGKTTTISIVCGLLAPDAGEVTVVGMPLTTRSVAEKAAIGYVPQELAIYPDLSARENLRFFARLYGLAPDTAAARVEEVLAVIGLTDRASEQTKSYSGGMQRRLNIGIGLLHRPRLLILDEPTVGVDPQSRNAILESVERLSGEGMAVLYTTHYMEEAERLCDRIGIVDLGELKAEGTRAELVAMVGEHDRVTLEGAGDLQAAARESQMLAPVRTASVQDGGIELIVDQARSLLPELLRIAADAGVAVSSVEVDEPNLEAVFLHLTGKALRD